MSPWLMAIITKRKLSLTTRTFTANASVTIPFGVSLLETVTGFGARGQAEGTRQTDHWTATGSRYTFYRDGTPPLTEIFTPTTNTGTGTKPADACNPDVTYDEPNPISLTRDCFTYTYDTAPVPATTGASSTGFSRTFPGSLGDTTPATTTFTAIPVTGGVSYPLVIPAGGSITITYYQ